MAISTAEFELPADNLVLPFAVNALGVRGQIIRLGEVANAIVHRHRYPPAVSALLSEAIALTAMLGSSLKFDGKFILQTSTDGPVKMLVSDLTTPGKVRGYAQFERDAVKALEDAGSVTPEALLGKGHLALTIDQGTHTERYQGIVALDGDDLSAAAHAYFAQSEQIPTSIRVSSGPLMERGAAEADNWRAGAIMVQHLPEDGGVSQMAFSSGDAPDGAEDTVQEHDDWVKARLLLETVEAHELLDPTLAPERLLYRLFHEDGVMVFPPTVVEDKCSCSRERLFDVLANFQADERTEMIENGDITATCEFCSTTYVFKASEFDQG